MFVVLAFYVAITWNHWRTVVVSLPSEFAPPQNALLRRFHVRAPERPERVYQYLAEFIVITGQLAYAMYYHWLPLWEGIPFTIVFSMSGGALA